MPYLGIFGLEFSETIVIFEIGTLKLVKNESLAHAVNFDIRFAFAFCKGPGSAFSEGPGPGPGPVYKVYRPPPPPSPPPPPAHTHTNPTLTYFHYIMNHGIFETQTY